MDIVTGGAGFIGSHLVDRLLSEGRKVRVIDNFSNGNYRNIAEHADNPKFSLAKADISDKAAIEGIFDGADRVFHLAALADIVPSICNPEAYFKANAYGTVNVLEAARSAKVRRFIYAASSSCYGIADQYPTPETAPARPQYPYALTKYLGEQLTLHWAQLYNLPAVSLRFFNVFGPRSRTSGAYGAVFGVFLAQLLANKPLTIVGDGRQTRDFTFVTDVVNAIVMMAETSIMNDCFNVGSNGTYSVNQLAKLLGATQVEFIPKRPGEPDCTFADVSKIYNAIGWRARVSFEEGVNTVLENIEYWRDAPVWTSQNIAKATADWFEYLGKSDPRAAKDGSK